MITFKKMTFIGYNLKLLCFYWIIIDVCTIFGDMIERLAKVFIEEIVNNSTVSYTHLTLPTNREV